MTSFKKYFSFTFKNSYMRLLIMTILAVILTFVSVRYIVNDVGYGKVYYYVRFNVLSIILGFLCFIVPIFELSPFKSRKSLDATMFLPVSKIKMSLAHYLNGLIQLIGIHTICVMVAFFKLLPHAKEIALGYLFAYFGLATVFGVLFYSIFMFAFYQSNHAVDGIVFEAGYTVILALLACPILEHLSLEKYVDPVSYFAIAPLFDLSNTFSNLAAHKEAYLREYNYIAFAVWFALGILAIVGYFYTFEKKKCEDAEAISNSIFGYRTLIPIGVYSLLLAFGGIFNEVFLIFIVVFMTSAYMIYRRTIRLKKQDIICILCSIVPWILGAVLDYFIYQQ